jgi:hypothetical protein
MNPSSLGSYRQFSPTGIADAGRAIIAVTGHRTTTARP